MSAQDDPQALRAALDALRREHEIVRMRLAEAITVVEARHGEHAQLTAALASFEAERERLAAALAAVTAERDAHAARLGDEAHRLATGVAAFARRHPLPGRFIMACVRLVLRLAGRG